MTLVVDAGPLYAYVDADDEHHEACLDLLETYPGPLIVPILVVTEVSYLVGTRLGPVAEVRFVGDLASGVLTAESVPPADWLRIAELVWDYRDLPLGTVDASVVAAAERLKITTIATLDRRHFTVVRSASAQAFELVPWLWYEHEVLAIDTHSVAGYVACMAESLALDDVYHLPADVEYEFNPAFYRTFG